MGLGGSLLVVARAFVDDLEKNYPRGRGSHMSNHVVLPCRMRFRDDSMSGNSKYIHTSNRCARVNPPTPMLMIIIRWLHLNALFLYCFFGYRCQILLWSFLLIIFAYQDLVFI